MSKSANQCSAIYAGVTRLVEEHRLQAPSRGTLFVTLRVHSIWKKVQPSSHAVVDRNLEGSLHHGITGSRPGLSPTSSIVGVSLEDA